MSDVTLRLHQTLQAVCPIVSVALTGATGPATIFYDPSATAQQIAAAQNALANFDWSDAAQTTWENLQDRTAADTLLTDPAPANKVQRAAILALVDYVNSLESWITQFTAAVAASTNLANLQSRVAALTVPPSITAANAKAAVKAKIDNGSAD